MVRKAVIPVAGLGTRFLPATKALPKELLPLVDKPVVQYIVEEAVASGIEEIIFITSQNKSAIQNYFSRDEALERELTEKKKEKELHSIKELHTLARFTYIMQDEPRGLGHAVLLAQEAIGDEPFVVFGGDDVVDAVTPAAKQLIDTYEQYQESVIGVMHVPDDAVSRYGIIHPQEQLNDTVCRIQDIVEKPSVELAPSRMAAAGRWLLTPAIFQYLERTPQDAAGEVQLTDALRALTADHAVYAKVYDGTYHDCGNKLEYIKAVVSFALKHPELGSETAAYLKQLISTL